MTVRPAAIFLDRDGTLIEDVGVLKNGQDIRLFPDTIEALLKLQKNYLLFVVTTQSGVAQGKLTLGEVAAVNRQLERLLADGGVRIQQWYVCPHSREERCACMKPKAAFLLEAERDYRLNLAQSFMIGDHPHDTLTANEQGVFGVYVLTGHGGKHLSELPAEKLVFHRIADAAEWILKHPDAERSIAQQIKRGAAEIQRGRLVAFPTETVYGLGADAFNPEAVLRIFTTKRRPLNNPLIVHVADMEQLSVIAESVPELAQRLIKQCWPGPLTVVLRKHAGIPDVVTCGNPTVAIRMPDNPIALKLIRMAGTPVAAPSANAFGCTSPTTAQHVRDQLGNLCDNIIDGGACRVGVESTVISFTGLKPVILRPGGVSAEEIEAVIGSVQTADAASSHSPESPGMLKNHYAPRTPLAVFTEIPEVFEAAADVGVLLFEPSQKKYRGPVEVLSRTGDINEAATNLYAALRRLDDLGLRQIVTCRLPDHGVGKAVNNRLEKASAGRFP